MRNTELMVGAFYNPHLGRELAVATGIDHLAMADPPAASDPWWPAISERYTLLLHDYLGQLSEPLDERSIQRARGLAELYRSPWVAEHFQCLHTEDGRYNLNYVFPPLYTEEFLARFIRNACALQARLDQPLVMENIPGFFDVKASQMPEPMWLRRFFEATGAGFLLDLPHVWQIEQEAGACRLEEAAQPHRLRHLARLHVEEPGNVLHDQRLVETRLERARVADKAGEELLRVERREHVVQVVAAVLGVEALKVLRDPG